MPKSAVVLHQLNYLQRLGITIFTILLLGSCNQQEIDSLQEENETLKSSQFRRDSIMRDLVRTFAAVDSNMKVISENEQQIELQIQNSTADEIQADSVLFYMNKIEALSESNQKLVEQLEQDYGSGDANIIGLKQLISSLNEKNDFKKNELGLLKTKLTTINKDFRELFEEFVHAEARKMELNEYNAALKEKNETLLKELNKGYYAIGSRADLKAKGLIDKKGVLFNADLNDNVDQSLFEEIDVRNLHFVDLNVKKAKIITNHPSGSYEVIGDRKRADKLLIKEPKEFWSLSKYLLIEIED